MTVSLASTGKDTHHNNESSWKPREVPLDEDCIPVLNAD
jgi:hypothetical protein